MIRTDGVSRPHLGGSQPPGNSNAIAISMVVISLAGSLVVMATSILFARLLGPEGFQAFAVAIAALSLAGTLCEFGTGKYALRVMPQYASQKQWSLAAGYIRYSAVLVVVTDLVGGLFGLWETGGFAGNSSGLSPFGLACLFPPVPEQQYCVSVVEG